MVVDESLVLVAEVCCGAPAARGTLGAGRSLKPQAMSQQRVAVFGLTNSTKPCGTQWTMRRLQTKNHQWTKWHMRKHTKRVHRNCGGYKSSRVTLFRASLQRHHPLLWCYDELLWCCCPTSEILTETKGTLLQETWGHWDSSDSMSVVCGRSWARHLLRHQSHSCKEASVPAVTAESSASVMPRVAAGWSGRKISLTRTLLLVDKNCPNK